MTRLFPLANVIDSDDWYTPSWIFDGLGITFDLDVAHPDHPTAVPCHRFLTVADDGLSADWFGLVWCNPPYSAPTRWCEKWARHEPGGCILLRADLSTSGPFVAFAGASSVYVPRRRLQFVSGSGARTGAVNFSTVLLGRGAVADAALARLAAMFGGTARTLAAEQGQP